jgi:hypothetical protein
VTWWVDPAKPGCKPVDFVFFIFLIKQRHFNLFFLNNPADPMIRSKPETRVLNRARHWAGSEPGPSLGGF